jgi:hypothetical protein
LHDSGRIHPALLLIHFGGCSIGGAVFAAIESRRESNQYSAIPLHPNRPRHNEAIFDPVSPESSSEQTPGGWREETPAEKEGRLRSDVRSCASCERAAIEHFTGISTDWQQCTRAFHTAA